MKFLSSRKASYQTPLFFAKWSLAKAKTAKILLSVRFGMQVELAGSCLTAQADFTGEITDQGLTYTLYLLHIKLLAL